MWMTDQLVSIVAGHLSEVDAALASEQAVYGLDAMSEVELHAVVEQAFTASGLGVAREFPYPGSLDPFMRDAARERCDLVLTPPGAPLPVDPVAAARARLAAPLFAGADPAEAVSDAFWLEMKAVAQLAFVDGIPMPNASYGALLVGGPAADVAKLARDAAIERGGVLVLLFGAEGAVVEHDLAAMATELVRRNLPIALPSVEVIAITDRVGNAVCGVCLVPLRAVR